MLVLQRRLGELGSRGKPFAPAVRRLALDFPKKGKALVYSGTDREKLRGEGPNAQASFHFTAGFGVLLHVIPWVRGSFLKAGQAGHVELDLQRQ